MGEISCENFYSVLPIIEAAIKECAFISIDMEFSKINNYVTKPFTFFDSNEYRYNKLRMKVSDITCIQLGLSIFTYDNNSKSFKTCAYSFFTYPQTFYKSDSVVSFQTSSVEFLCKHKFDFNKLFHTRIPYLTDEQEMAIKSEMLDSLFFDKYFKTNLKFRSIEEELLKVLNIVFKWYENAICGDNTFLEINGCNEPAYIILLKYYILKKLIYVSIDENQSGLSITKMERNEDLEMLNNEIYENLKQSLLYKMMGIKHLIKLISKSKKPLIGHNCGLDILILCNQFFKPLPESFKDFQSFVTHNFGPIYDTKLLCKELKRIIPKNDKWMGNSLSEIYLYLKDGDGKVHSEMMCIELVAGISESQDTQFHHAGWDAYCTGFCFLKITHSIKMLNTKMGMYQKFTFTELLKSVEYSKNKFYTYRSVSNSIYLEGNECYNDINFLIIQNKGFFYRTLDLEKLKHDLKQTCNFDIKLLSNYTALVIPSFLNNQIMKNIKLKYHVEDYSHYQRRKKQQICFSFIIITATVSIIAYLRK